MNITKEDIEDAVRLDYEWLTGPAQDIESWSGTQPDDVDPLDMPSGVTTTRLGEVDDDERHDELMKHAFECWNELA